MNSLGKPPVPYRPEIDGLRALAVLPVVLFHADVYAFSGGYVGVDVFFVISGYLITSLLLDELGRTGRISIIQFYERRARRLLPALAFVLLPTCVMAYLFLSPPLLKEFGINLVGVALFASNITLWQQGGYFAGPAEENPLLHTWSLAVEEQFYIVFPPLLLLMWILGARYRGMAVCLGLLVLVSLLGSELGRRYAATANFYLLPTRAWELGFGAIVALAHVRNTRPKHTILVEGLGFAGLALIVFAILWFDRGTPFPSLYTVVPVLGTALFIWSAQDGSIVARVLSIRPLVWVGLVSYSTYLWHQPLLAFARVSAHEEPSQWLLLLLAAGSVGLGWITWRFVERPFRNRAFLAKRTVFAGSLGVLLCCGAVGAFFLKSDFWLSRYPEHLHAFLVKTTKEHGVFTRSEFDQTVSGKPFVAGPRLLVVGDSFAQDFYQVLKASDAFPGYSISADYVFGRCQIYAAGPRPLEHIRRADIARCNSPENQFTAEVRSRIAEADVIVLASFWQAWAAEALPETLQALEVRTDVPVFAIGSKYFGEFDLTTLKGRTPTELAEIRVPRSPETLRIADLLRQDEGPYTYIDIMDLVCETDKSCRQFTPEGVPIAYDKRHLTPEGAAFLGKLLFSRTQLKAYKRPEG